MNKDFKKIILDMDGTLLDSTVLMPYIQEIKIHPSGTEGNKEAWKEHDRQIQNCKLFNGIDNVFDFIRANQISTAIVSNSCKRRIESICKAFNVPVSTNLMIGRFSVNRFRSIIKPDVRIFQKAINLLGTKPEDIISFGNEASDIITSQKAGVESVACLWGASEQEKKEILQAHPYYIIESPIEIIPLLYK